MAQNLGQKLKEKCIIVIDDEESLREIYITILKKAGYHAVATQDPIEAFIIAEEQEDVWLFITDYCMPRIDGANFIDLARQRFPGVPIIMISGYVLEAENIMKNLSNKPDAIVNKLIKKQDLCAIVDQFAQKYLAQKEAR